MPDVGRVRKNQVWGGRATWAGNNAGEIALDNVKTRLCPQVAGGIAEAGIEFDANGAFDSLGAEDR